jgi:bisphosphoglycerate-independent phosphoglycerate mutase (AlkP superfamily)
VLIDAVEKAKAAGGAVHIMGLLSEGGVHSHEDDIEQIMHLIFLKTAEHYVEVYHDHQGTRVSKLLHRVLIIRTGDFFKHEVLIDAVEKAKAAGGAVHIMGLLSEGGVPKDG